MHQGNAEEVATKLSGEDYQKYLQNQMGLYGMGIQGNQNINQMGFDANKDYANSIANMLGTQGAYNFMGQQGQNQAKQQGMGNIFSGLGMAASSFLPGGSWWGKQLFGGGQ